MASKKNQNCYQQTELDPPFEALFHRLAESSANFLESLSGSFIGAAFFAAVDQIVHTAFSVQIGSLRVDYISDIQPVFSTR